MTDGDGGQSIDFPVDVRHQVTAMHVPPPCSGTGHTGILCSQEAPGPGSGLRTWNLQPRRPSARLQCWGSCRAQPQVWSHTRHAATPGIWVHVCAQSVSFNQVRISSFCTGRLGSGTRFPESLMTDETLESSVGLSLLGSHQRNDRGTQKNRRERPLVLPVVAEDKAVLLLT